jgi:hydrogenase-4 component F
MEILILLLTPILAVITIFLFSKNKIIVNTTSVVAAAIELIASIFIALRVADSGFVGLTQFFSFNALGALLLLVVTLIGFFVTVHSTGYLEAERKKGMLDMKRVKECFILLRFFLFFMFLVLCAQSPIMTWIAIEATTLTTVFLVSLFNRDADIEAAWKYLIINSTGLLFGLLGMFLFLAQGNGVSTTWADLFAQTSNMDPLLTKFAFAFVFLGYATKMGIVPMHTWKPDAYNKAPLPIVALLSGALLNVAFFGLLRFSVIADIVVGAAFTQNIFMFFGALSVVLAGFVIYTQVNFKRLLAYHSIEHAGIIMLGMGFGGIGIFGALLHMIYYALAKALLALASSNIALKYSTSEIHKVKGLVKALPVTSVLYAIGFFVLMGIAPSGIFFSELYILLAGFGHNLWVALLMLATIVFVFVGFVRHFFEMFFGEVPQGISIGERSWVQFVPAIILTIIILIFGLAAPSIFSQLLTQSVTYLKGAMP